MTDQKNEEKIRESRESNLIIHRFEESKEPLAEARVQHDAEFFDKLCVAALGIGKVEVNKIIRLGKKNEQNKRPMRVILKNKGDRTKLFRSLRKLKGAEAPFRDISVTADYSQEEQTLIREKVAEAKELSKNEEGIIYKIRGPPWNLRMEKTIITPEDVEP